jgi:hypothetical protein
MTPRRISPRIGLIVLLIAAVALSSCGKQEPAGKPTPSSGQNQAPKAEEKPVIDSLAAVPIGYEALPIILPKPMFEGTPIDLEVPNLERPRGKPRPAFYVPKGTVLISKGKPVTGSDNEPILGELEMITDGDKEAPDGSYVELGPFKQFVTVDLETEYEIYAVLVWHYHKKACVYFDVVAQISSDNDMDNTSGMGVGQDPHYVETSEGRLIDAKGIKGRYVRFYSNGNKANDLNHYIEIEVWGKPLI